MNDVVRISKKLSWLLRHGAGEKGLAMTPDGWASIDDVLLQLGIERSALDRAVERNDKNRLQVDGPLIRACQGHSLAGMPVTVEALERTWQRVHPTAPLWHGTTPAAVPAIRREGLRAGRRTHVHLAPSPDSHIGKRFTAAVLLRIDPTGLVVFEAPNGVLLTRHVPPGAIAGGAPLRSAGCEE